MTNPLCSRIGVAICFMAGALAAQQPKSPPEPRFEAVSIRALPPNVPRILIPADFTPVLPGGKYINSRAALHYMISFAYDVKAPIMRRLIGLPDWAKKHPYAVSAAPGQDFPALPAAENDRQVRLMMRTMLEDRFHLKLHTEIRQETVFFLDVTKSGFKFMEVNASVPPEKEGRVNAAWGDSGGSISGNRSTIAGLAATLAIILERPVMDRTGLKGYYNFDVSWKAPEPLNEQPPGPRFGPEGIALLHTMLQDRFGLRITKATGPVKYWVVDRVEEPTDN
jgi:uncharacterized protein (TIGR03435 family)